MSRVLFGRDADLQSLSALLDAHRLVTIAGPGGVGKTALATRLRETCPSAKRASVRQIELVALTDADQVMPALVRALELPVSKLSPRDVALEALRRKPHLLVFDNCEHLLPSLADVVAELLTEVEELSILATSQEALNLSTERVYRLGALELPAIAAELDVARNCGAIALFAHRASAADQHFTLTPENIDAVSDICRQLDGIPLAIELAAARLRMLGVEGLRTRLDDRLQLLSHGARDRPARHRTLRAALEWSWSLLHEAEQTVFRRLGVMAGSFDLEAAQAVAADETLDSAAVTDALGVLCDKSLVAVEPESAGIVRYRLLETMRHFALDQLRAVREEIDARERHLVFFLGLAESAGKALAGPQQGAWLARLDRDRENLYAAHLACDTLPDGVERGLRLANSLIRYWFNRDALLLGQRIVEEALARKGIEQTPHGRARALTNFGRMLVFRGLDNEAAAQFRHAIEVSRQCGAKEVTAEALARLGYALITLNDRTGARALLEEACELAGTLDDPRYSMVPQSNLAELERMEGNFEAAMQRYQACYAIDIAAGDRQATMISHNNLAMTALALKRFPAVRDHLRASLIICEELDSRRGRLVVMEACAGLAAELEDWANAVRFDAAASHLTAAMGRRRDAADEVLLAPLILRARRALGRKPTLAAEAEGLVLDYESAIEAMHDWLDSRQDLTPVATADPVLTAREQEILSLIARGYGNSDVARLLEISVLTVRTHRQRLMDKLQLHNAAEITAYAVKMGWYDPN